MIDAQGSCCFIASNDTGDLLNGVPVGFAKPYTFDGHPLEPIAETVIPPGHYYVQGTHPNSFDSRYSASGLVAARQVIGRVRPLF